VSIAHFRFILSAMFVLALGASLMVSVVDAQTEKTNVDANVSTRVNVGQSRIQANTTSHESAKAELNTTTSSNAKPQGEYQSAQTESHDRLKTSYDMVYAGSDNTLAVQTQRHLYKPGDAVSIEGIIWSGLSASVGGINTVSVQVTDDGGNEIYTEKEQVNNGEYSGSFELPTDAKKGAYTIHAKADVNAEVLSTLTLKMQAGLDSTTKFMVENPIAWAIKAGGHDFDVNITSDSDVTDVKFDEQAKKLSFGVQGETGTTGVTDITIPKSLLSGDLTVMIDGQVMASSDVVKTSDVQDETTLEINYHHSSHVIEITGTNAVPEFPISTVIMALAISSVIILASYGNMIIKRN